MTMDDEPLIQPWEMENPVLAAACMEAAVLSRDEPCPSCGAGWTVLVNGMDPLLLREHGEYCAL